MDLTNMDWLPIVDESRTFQLETIQLVIIMHKRRKNGISIILNS